MPPPAKRRKTESKVEEITFDTEARQEFLTGFHKRKVQRAKHAQERAEQRAREEKIRDRKKLRDERKVELEQHVKAINQMLEPTAAENEQREDASGTDGSEDKDEVLQASDTENIVAVDHEAEYIDEDKYTTVTVETISVTRDGFLDADGTKNTGIVSIDAEEDGARQDSSEGLISQPNTVRQRQGKRPWTKDRPADMPKRPKKKRNFKYEGKIERKAGRVKVKLKNRKQAQARKGV